MANHRVKLVFTRRHPGDRTSCFPSIIKRKIIAVAFMNAMLHRSMNIVALRTGINRHHPHRRSNSWIQLRRYHYGHEILQKNAHLNTRHPFSRNLDARPMSSASTGDYSLDLCIPTPEDMEDIGGLLSINSTSGDIILLDGDLGAGKTCFSRGFIRGRCGLPNERVTSPTYLLSNTYPVVDDTADAATTGVTTLIHHMDLYRLRARRMIWPR